MDALENLLHQNPDHALSRLVCPRKLNPKTAYHAFLIPSFEVGRLAGLNQPTAGLDALVPSWGAGQADYPYYYRWNFQTGDRGDFEYLVNLLEPREVDERVGMRDMDMQHPDFGTTGMSSGPGDIPVMGLEGALKNPNGKSKTDRLAARRQDQLSCFLERPGNHRQSAGNTAQPARNAWRASRPHHQPAIVRPLACPPENDWK